MRYIYIIWSFLLFFSPLFLDKHNGKKNDIQYPCLEIGTKDTVWRCSDQELAEKHGSHSNLPVHDVAIVGGGMVGMALACSLAHQPLTNQLNFQKTYGGIGIVMNGVGYIISIKIFNWRCRVLFRTFIGLVLRTGH